MIRLDLQFFGGRGAGSQSSKPLFAGKEYGINVTMADGTKLNYIISERDGTTYVQRGFSETPQPFPLSGRQLVQRAQKNGATVEVVTPAETAKKRKAYWDERNARPDYELGVGLTDNRGHRKRARQNRLETRMMRRKGR